MTTATKVIFVCLFLSTFLVLFEVHRITKIFDGAMQALVMESE